MSLQTELNLVQEILNRGRTDEARTRINSMLERAPNEPGVLHAHAVIMWKSSQHALAVASMKKAVDHAPDPGPLLLQLAQMQHGVGSTDDAVETLRALVAYDLANPEPVINLSALLIETGRTDEAHDVLKAAANTFGNVADIHFNLGVVQKRLGLLTPAVSSYRNAVRLASDNPNYILALGCAEIDIQDYTSALETLRPLSAQYPDNDEVAERLGFALTQTNNPKEAVEIFQRLAAKHPDNIMINERLMYNQMLLKKWPDAREQCDTILGLEAGNVGTLGYRKFILDEVGAAPSDEALYDIDTWIKRQTIDVPDGYSSLEDFNAQLADEILIASKQDQETPAISCHNGKIVADLGQCKGAAIAAFVATINKTMAAYVAAFQPPEITAWSNSAPAAWETYIWSTVLNDGGYQDSHMHPSAWLSGVYYVNLPDSLGNGTENHDGWLEFGQAPRRLPVSQQSQTQMIQPEPGLIVFFPSYFHHRTVPFNSADQRISIAFDLEPRQVSP